MTESLFWNSLGTPRYYSFLYKSTLSNNCNVLNCKNFCKISRCFLNVNFSSKINVFLLLCFFILFHVLMVYSHIFSCKSWMVWCFDGLLGSRETRSWKYEYISNLQNTVLISVSDPDPYHLVGSVSGNVDMDPGSAKN